MSGSFVPTGTMFGVMSDRHFYFPRYEANKADEEYGYSLAQFLDEYPEDAFADVQEIWDKADSALRRELLMVCQERLMQKIQQMEEEYRQTDKERHRYEVCADFKQNG